MTERKLRIGVVGLSGSWSTEALADAIAERTGYRLIVDMARVVLDLETGQAHYGDVDLCDLSGLIVKKVTKTYSADTLDRLELLRFVENRGVRVFSPPANIARLIDRLSCTVMLRQCGIPMPRTVVTEDLDHAVESIRAFGTAVLKPLYSTKARGMVLIDAAKSADIRDALLSFKKENKVLYIQQKVDIPGRDLGVAFLGGEFLGTYARVIGDKAWNTTIKSGGQYAPHTATQETIDLAQRAQAPFGLDFTTVDVVETNDGPVVFEVSAFGGFSGLRVGVGLDAASLYSDYVAKELRT